MGASGESQEVKETFTGENENVKILLITEKG